MQPRIVRPMRRAAENWSTFRLQRYVMPTDCRFLVRIHGTQREIRGIPGAQINRIQTYSRVSRTLGRSFQTNFFVQTYVASVNLINCCEMARSRDPYFISAICHHVSRIFYAATCCIQNNVLSLSLCFPFSFFAPAPVIIYVKVQGLT